MAPSIMIAPSGMPTLSEAVTLIGCVPLTVAPARGLTIEVVGAVVSVAGVGAGVGGGVGTGVGARVGMGVGGGVGDAGTLGVGLGVAEGPGELVPDCAS